jgi:adhesin transport system outer membrane protein
VTLICGWPLYSNATDPEFDLAEKPRVFSHNPAYLHLLWQRVVQDHPQVLLQRQTLKATGFDIEASEQAFYPTPSISVERAQSNGSFDPSYAGSPQVAIFKLQQPLWTGGRLSAQRNKALASQDIEWARLLEIQQNMALKTLQAWTEVVSAQRQQMALSRTQIELEHLQRKIERRAEQGLSTQSEVKLSSLKVSLVKQMLNQVRIQEDLAWLRLMQWVPEAQTLNAQALTNEVAWKDDQAHLQPIQHIDWASLSAKQSPVAMRLLSLLKAQDAELEEKRAAYQPEVYLRAERQHGSFAYSNAQNINRVFIGMTATTGAGLSLQHQLAALVARHVIAQYDIDIADRLLTETVQSDVLNLIARQSKTEELKLNLELLHDIQEAWLRQFDNGRKSWLEVMNAVQESMQGQLTLIENDTSLQLSYWRLQIHAYGVSNWIQP